MLQDPSSPAVSLAITTFSSEQQIKQQGNKYPDVGKHADFIQLVQRVALENDKDAIAALKEKEPNFKLKLALALLNNTDMIARNLDIFILAASLTGTNYYSTVLATTETLLTKLPATQSPSWAASVAYSALSSLTSLVRSPATLETKEVDNTTPLTRERLFPVFFGMNPLHRFAYYGETAQISPSKEAGNAITGFNTYRQTPLMVACAHSPIATVLEVIRVGGAEGIVDKKSVFNDTTLHYAAKNAEPAVVAEVFKQAPELIEVVNNQGQTPLMVACQNGLTLTALKLVELGANIAAQDTEGLNALHYCVVHGHSELAKLLTPPADPNAPDDGHALARAQLAVADHNGRTPAHHAIDRNDRNLLMYFVAVNKALLQQQFPMQEDEKESYLLDYFAKHAKAELAPDEIIKVKQLLDLNAMVSCSGKEHSLHTTATQQLDNIIFGRRAATLASLRAEAALEKHQVQMTVQYTDGEIVTSVTDSKASVLLKLIHHIETNPTVDSARCLTEWEAANPQLQFLLDSPDASFHGAFKKAIGSGATTGAKVRAFGGTMFAPTKLSLKPPVPNPVVPVSVAASALAQTGSGHAQDKAVSTAATKADSVGVVVAPSALSTSLTS